MIKRIANENDIAQIMEIVENAKSYMKENKINQWSENYPNEDVFLTDSFFCEFISKQNPVGLSFLILHLDSCTYS